MFKKSFTLYVESGMREKAEADIQVTDIWTRRDEQQLGHQQGTEEFYKFIIEHHQEKPKWYFLHFCTEWNKFTLLKHK